MRKIFGRAHDVGLVEQGREPHAAVDEVGDGGGKEGEPAEPDVAMTCDHRDIGMCFSTRAKPHFLLSMTLAPRTAEFAYRGEQCIRLAMQHLVEAAGPGFKVSLRCPSSLRCATAVAMTTLV